MVFLWARHVEAIGLGDVKFSIGAGLLLGASSLPIFLVLASFFGFLTFACKFTFCAHANYTGKMKIPFGPSLSLATFLLFYYEYYSHILESTP